MREITDRELYKALEYARSIDETTGRKILDQFQREQPALAQTIFAILPGVIAEQDQNMAHLFMDLCFDLICVFEKTFGPLPPQHTMGFEWLEKMAALLDTELQALLPEKTMAAKLRDKLQDRLMTRVTESDSQARLTDFMNAAINHYATECQGNEQSIRTTQTMIFVVIQLLSHVYDHATAS